MTGDNVSFTLIDEVFTRKLFTLLSWAGNAKKGTSPKPAFKDYVRTIDFFFKLVNSIDESYTKIQLATFLHRKAINCSNRRANRNSKRISRTKIRGHSSYKNYDDDEELENELVTDQNDEGEKEDAKEIIEQEIEKEIENSPSSTLTDNAHSAPSVSLTNDQIASSSALSYFQNSLKLSQSPVQLSPTLPMDILDTDQSSTQTYTYTETVNGSEAMVSQCFIVIIILFYFAFLFALTD